jgi:opacity protein-like surface antigen
MKKMLSMAALGALLATANVQAGKNVDYVESDVVPVVANLPFYIGIGGMWTGVSRDCPCTGSRLKDSTYGGLVRLGYDFNPYFGVEGRALKVFGGSDFSETYHYGFYLKPQYHITQDVNVYALVGYGHTEVKCTASNSARGGQNFSKTGLSFGAGIEYDLSPDRGVQGDEEEGWGLFLDWQNLAYKDSPQNTNVNVVTAGITYDF